MPHLSYARQCYNAATPGSRFCYAHGGRNARLVVRKGVRRDSVELACEHLYFVVKFETSKEARRDWTRELLRRTHPHKCFAALRRKHA